MKNVFFWRSASITLDNNNDVLTDLSEFFSLDTLPHTYVSLTCCISIDFFSFEYFPSFDHYAACWVTLRKDLGYYWYAGGRIIPRIWRKDLAYPRYIKGSKIPRVWGEGLGYPGYVTRGP